MTGQEIRSASGSEIETIHITKDLQQVKSRDIDKNQRASGNSLKTILVRAFKARSEYWLDIVDEFKNS